MIEIFQHLPEQQRSLVRQHEGLLRVYRLTKRYRRMVREIVQGAVGRPVPAFIPIDHPAAMATQSRHRSVA